MGGKRGRGIGGGKKGGKKERRERGDFLRSAGWRKRDGLVFLGGEKSKKKRGEGGGPSFMSYQEGRLHLHAESRRWRGGKKKGRQEKKKKKKRKRRGGDRVVTFALPFCEHIQAGTEKKRGKEKRRGEKKKGRGGGGRGEGPPRGLFLSILSRDLRGGGEKNRGGGRARSLRVYRDVRIVRYAWEGKNWGKKRGERVRWVVAQLLARGKKIGKGKKRGNTSWEFFSSPLPIQGERRGGLKKKKRKGRGGKKKREHHRISYDSDQSHHFFEEDWQHGKKKTEEKRGKEKKGRREGRFAGAALIS